MKLLSGTLTPPPSGSPLMFQDGYAPYTQSPMPAAILPNLWTVFVPYYGS